ncbi:MAG: hypothetical protein HYU64_06120 [Armatimonadetes bacterium]|nr:hypothetical protein [Armatimonadota bacterium]
MTDFIAEHHGTSLVTYFYHLAVNATGADAVAQDDFRYDGPRPGSRETAVVMFADAVEAATRAIKNPTPSKVDNVVRQIAHRLLVDGQFDECQLSFRDLTDITSTFVKIINGMYHTRIEYPETLALPVRSDLPSPLREAKRRRFGIFKYR